MKLLSVTVPCYNSEEYMERCIDSILAGGEDVEIIIVDDGSTKDRTAEIADEYAEKYPSIIKTVHQENRGHGGAVNTGIENATGVYFKVVDSDDMLDAEAYLKVLDALKNIVRGHENVDMFIANYTYDKVGKKRKRTMRFSRHFPQDKIFYWDEMLPLDMFHYVLMHNIIYRTALLQDLDYRLPEHTFYVDNLYAFVPVSRVKNLYYINENLYQYHIGRQDQSVNEQVMISRIDQQININNMMIDYMADMQNKIRGNQKKFMMHYLGIIMIVTSVLLLRMDTKESISKRNELWKNLRKKSPESFRRLRRDLLGILVFLPTKAGRKLTVFGYKLCNMIYGFN